MSKKHYEMPSFESSCLIEGDVLEASVGVTLDDNNEFGMEFPW